MKLTCGHNSSCELDTICPQCGRSFITMPFMPFAIGVVLVLFIYYSDGFFLGTYNEKLTLLFVLFVWYLEICILRMKRTELIANLLISIPVLVIAFQHISTNFWGVEINSVIIIVAYLLLSIPFALAIFLGLKDAAYYDQLNKGSFWLIISFFVSLVISILYYCFPFIQKLNPFIQLNTTLTNIYYYLDFVFNLRTAIIAVTLGVVTVISISKALLEELHVKKSTTKPTGEISNSSVDVILVGLSSFFGNVGEAILTVMDLVKQILAIVFLEVFKLIKDSLVRSVLIILRVLRVATLALIVLGIAVTISKIVNYVVLLWVSSSFFSMNIYEWLKFLGLCLLLGISIWLFTMFTYKKWRDYSSFPLGVKRTFITFFGTKNEALIAHRSITISVFMHMFFLGLAFLGAWLIINPTHLILNLNKPAPIGILFCSTIFLTIILGSSLLIKSNR